MSDTLACPYCEQEYTEDVILGFGDPSCPGCGEFVENWALLCLRRGVEIAKGYEDEMAELTIRLAAISQEGGNGRAT